MKGLLLYATFSATSYTHLIQSLQLLQLLKLPSELLKLLHLCLVYRSLLFNILMLYDIDIFGMIFIPLDDIHAVSYRH